nr:PREDICTED: facilitated trehalose transporter Tret1-like [Bemisia tabaci]
MTSSVSDEETRGKISSNEETKDKTVSDIEIGAKPVNDEECGEEVSWRCWIRTLFAASGAMMVFVFTGVTEAQSAVMLPQLKKPDSYIRVGPDEETWIASLGILLAPPSGILVGPVIDAFGRKKGLLFFFLCMGLGFAVIACATEVYHIYIGRCICAFAVGLEVVAVVYLAEISTKRQRSGFFSMMSVVFSGGVTLTYLIGGYLPWYIASAIFSAGCFAYFAVVCFAPESPAWLFKTGQIDASTKSFLRLGRSHVGIVAELENLKLSSKEDDEKLEFKAFLEPTVWKPFVILSMYHIFQCGTGVYDILYYTVDFVESLGTSYDPLPVSILLSVARFVTTATLGIYFTASVSRKFATAFSAFWMAVTLAGTGVYTYVYRDTTQKPYDWFPIVCMLINIVASALGVTSLPLLMSGEVFPLRVRGAMTGASFLIGLGALFVVVKIYAFCLQILQIWGLLFVYAVFSVLCVLLGVFLLPETQGKTLWEIEQGFLPKKDRRRNGE